VTSWHEEPIRRTHNRQEFDCGEPTLNEFLQRYARKSHELGGARMFLAIDDGDDETIPGFYSLSPASVEYARTPEVVRRGLTRYDVPCFRLARLAVDLRAQKQGLGGTTSAGCRPALLACGSGSWRHRASDRRQK